MWYNTTDSNEIDFHKPIIAYNDVNEYLLLPTINLDNKIIKYNWFSITQGKFNSTCGWKTASAAISCYRTNHKIYNCKIEIIKIKPGEI